MIQLIHSVSRMSREIEIERETSLKKCTIDVGCVNDAKLQNNRADHLYLHIDVWLGFELLR